MNWSDLQLITFAKINIMMKRISFLLSVIFLTTAGFLCKPAGKYGKVLSSEQRLRVDLTKLASDEFEARFLEINRIYLSEITGIGIDILIKYLPDISIQIQDMNTKGILKKT
jgi:hypothetical protein